jgi:CubicO group peptidase (beta-lactamase class C family)
LIRIVLIALLWLVAIAVPALAADLNETIPQLLQKWNIQNASVAVLKPNKPEFVAAYDLNAAEHHVTADTRFRIASVSKVVTAAAINKMIDDGQLTLATKLFDVFPEKNYAIKDARVKSIAVGDLLNMTAGWNDGRKRDPILNPRAGTIVPAGADSFEETFKYMLNRRLKNPPAEKYSYSNFSYDVLAKIIELKSGKTYAEFVSDSLGMKNCVPGKTNKEDLPPEPEEARYFTFDGDKLNPYTRANLEEHVGSLGVCTTALELARLAANQHVGGVTPPVRFQRPDIERWRQSYQWFASGWEVAVTPAGYTLFKDGSLPGTRAFTGVNADGTAWAVLFNGRPKWKKGDPFGTAVRAMMRDF